MSKKMAERGTKRTCQSCEARFYDLNRDPILCPMCGAAFVVAAAALGGQPAVADKVRKPVKKPEIEPAEVPAEVADLPADVVAEDADVAEDAATADEETFLEQEEEDTDVSGFIDTGIEEQGEEET